MICPLVNCKTKRKFFLIFSLVNLHRIVSINISLHSNYPENSLFVRLLCAQKGFGHKKAPVKNLTSAMYCVRNQKVRKQEKNGENAILLYRTAIFFVLFSAFCISKLPRRLPKEFDKLGFTEILINPIRFRLLLQDLLPLFL